MSQTTKNVDCKRQKMSIANDKKCRLRPVAQRRSAFDTSLLINHEWQGSSAEREIRVSDALKRFRDVS